MPGTPPIIEVNKTQLQEVLHRVEQSLDDKDVELIRAVFQSYLYVTDLVEDKNTSIRRLRQLLFGARTEKTDAVVGQPTDRPQPTMPSGVATGTESAARDAAAEASGAAATGPARRGHGRNGADAYRGAARIDVPHPALSAGDACPACGQGTVYEKAPGVLVRIIGQPPLAATIYQLQKLRCQLCGQVFTAAAPAEAGSAKYDATAASMIGLLKYGSGLPFNRLAGLQGYLEIPLPASTQWDIVAAVAASLTPAFDELIRQAAQGDVLHNDDTTVKILELMGQRGRAEDLAGPEEEGDEADERTGLFTSGVVALRDGHRVALFFSVLSARMQNLFRRCRAGSGAGASAWAGGVGRGRVPVSPWLTGAARCRWLALHFAIGSAVVSTVAVDGTLVEVGRVGDGLRGRGDHLVAGRCHFPPGPELPD
jgi:transposase